MRKRKIINDLPDLSNRRLISAVEGCNYTGMGKDSFNKFAHEIGAIKRFGRRVFYDRLIIDRAIDASGEELKGGEL
jgi:hypothetical protein